MKITYSEIVQDEKKNYWQIVNVANILEDIVDEDDKEKSAKLTKRDCYKQASLPEYFNVLSYVLEADADGI